MPDPGRIAAAAIVATIAFWSYTQTLLPGVDLGDTGGFQAAVLWPQVSARQSYPLYYALAKPFVAATSPTNPARALNLFSAVCAAAAVGLLVYFVATVTGAVAAGAVAGLLLAFSYSFWSQAIIAEVYALHLALVALCLIALQFYATAPSTPRLALFFALYALSFGNHLSMILLLVPFTLFLLLVTPRKADLFRPGVIALAIAAALAGALQYWPNLMAVASSPTAPRSLVDQVAAFWFDATKADWREEMVLGISGTETANRLAMWWFDARQQFGIAGLVLAAVGAARLWWISRPWGATVIVAFAIATTFALTYNVGDSHVFFLPSHFLTALCAGAVLGHRVWPSTQGQGHRVWPLIQGHTRCLLAIILLAFTGWRGWSTWPAMDRHDDRRGEALVERLTLGVSDPDAMLLSQMNWQLENVLLYIGRTTRPDVTWTRLADVLPHLPFFVDDQREISRQVILTESAARDVVSAYGPLLAIVEDDTVPVLPFAAEAARVPRGAPYVLTLLTPPSDEPFDAADVDAAVRSLTGDRPPQRAAGHFELIAGMAGQAPSVYRSSDRPFSEHFRLKAEATSADEMPFTVRMDSWLPYDTFRRPGFGHVLRGRQHVQILERGVNLVWVGADGRVSPPIYAASLFAPRRRFRVVAAAPPQFARVSAQRSRR